MQLQVGTRLGPYEILSALGAGGMGEVYRARDTKLDREVAIKVLKKQDDALAVERFFREARAASALNHPNIVTVFDAGQAAQGHYIVMELVRGRGLRSLIGQPIDAEKLLSLARQMAEALVVAHEAGIVHRDVKPENIMVRDDGYVKVLDFGLARLSPQIDSAATRETVIATESRTLVGTIKYMSPEQAAGGRLGTMSDVFSLGVVLYELATGRHPFDAESSYKILLSIVSHHPVLPSRLNPELSGPWDTLLVRMLEKDESRRPSAAEVTTALAAWATRTTMGVVPAPVASKRLSVGRLRARAELRGAFKDVGKGRGLLVCVPGEAGLGKTTLVEDFLAEVAEVSGACTVARGRCSERLAGTEAYLPLLDALDDLLRSEGGALARLMKTIAPLWYVQVAPAGLQDSSGERLAQEARIGTQERLKRELVAFLEEASRRAPIVFFFDDLHWVDLSTIDVLGYVTRHFEALRVLIVVAYRPEELLVQKHPFLSTKRDLQSRGFCRELALEFLTREEVEQYIAAKYPNHRLARRFVDLIYAKTEGNPLFMVDVLGYLSAQNVLSREQDEWKLTRSVPEIARELPESVRGMIQRKIDLFSDADRRLLVAASVQGYEFDGAIVAKVLGVDPADIEDRLDVIDRIHGFVRQVRELEFPDRTLTLRYQFVHVLYQNLLYASLTPARKASLSRAVGKALEECYGDKTGDIVSELAVLFEAARDFSLATDYFQLAARKAADLFAYEEAFLLGRRALDALRALPDCPERRRRELTILITVGVPSMASRGYSSLEVREIYDRASALCLEFNETRQLAPLLYGQFAFNIVRLQLDRAREASDRLNYLAQQGGDSSVAALGAITLGLVHYYGGEFQAAAQHFHRMAVHYDLEQRRSMYTTVGYDPAMAAHAYLGWSLWCLGYPDGGREGVEAAVRAAGELEHAYTLAFALHFAGTVYAWRGDWEQVRIYNERTLKVANDERLYYYTALGVCLDGLCLARQDRREEGLARMREGLERLQTISGRSSWRRFASDFAEQLALAGRLDEGLNIVDKEIEETGSDHFWDTELFRVKGELLLMRGTDSATAEAERCFRQAIDVARQQRAKSFELRASLSLFRLWLTQEKPSEAASLLSGIYGWFTEGFETADLKAARRMLAVTAAGDR